MKVSPEALTLLAQEAFHDTRTADGIHAAGGIAGLEEAVLRKRFGLRTGTGNHASVHGLDLGLRIVVGHKVHQFLAQGHLGLHVLAQDEADIHLDPVTRENPAVTGFEFRTEEQFNMFPTMLNPFRNGKDGRFQVGIACRHSISRVSLQPGPVASMTVLAETVSRLPPTSTVNCQPEPERSSFLIRTS